MIVYKVTNNENGKVYVGQTIHSLGERQRKHYSSTRNGSQLYFHNTLRKYSKTLFEWEILEYCKTQQELNQKEAYYVDLYKSHHTMNGYNMSFGGDGNGGLHGETNGMYGKKHSPETIRKISETRKGQFVGDNNPAAINSGTYLITHPDGHQEKVKNLRKWCRNMSLNHVSFYLIVNGKQKSPYKGYWVERIKDGI